MYSVLGQPGLCKEPLSQTKQIKTKQNETGTKDAVHASYERVLEFTHSGLISSSTGFHIGSIGYDRGLTVHFIQQYQIS